MKNLKSKLVKNKEVFYLIILILSIIILNFRGFVLNPNRSFFNFISSIIYVLISIYLAYKNKEDIKVSYLYTIYWIITTLVAIAYYFIYVIGYSGEFFAPLALVFLTPIYAIGEFLFPFSIYKVYFTVLISFIMFLYNYKNFRDLEKEDEKLMENLGHE